MFCIIINYAIEHEQSTLFRLFQLFERYVRTSNFWADRSSGFRIVEPPLVSPFIKEPCGTPVTAFIRFLIAGRAMAYGFGV
jgi:hypothetical protein